MIQTGSSRLSFLIASRDEDSAELNGNLDETRHRPIRSFESILDFPRKLEAPWTLSLCDCGGDCRRISVARLRQQALSCINIDSATARLNSIRISTTLSINTITISSREALSASW